MSKHEILLRVRVISPVAGITMQVQRGRHELLPPMPNGTNNELVFEFPVNADLSGKAPNFLGPFAQGPKSSRFVYVNSGQCAGQANTECARRAKLSLMNITKQQIEEIVSTGDKLLEVKFNGTGSDGWPTCASVKGIEWKVVKK